MWRSAASRRRRLAAQREDLSSVMISVYCWNAGQAAGLWLDPSVLRDKADSLRDGQEVIWIDLADPSPEEEQLAFQQFFPVHPLTLEDITKLRREPSARPHFPKVEEFADYLFIVVNPLAGPVQQPMKTPVTTGLADGYASTQLSAILSQRILITHHYQPLSSVDQLRSFLGRHESQADRGPDYLFHLVLDGMVDEYAPVLDTLEDRLDGIELGVFENPSQQLLTQLLELKRAIITLRKTLVYEREVLARLSRGEFALIDEREMVYYRNVYDHVVRFTELIESSREMVSDLMQTHLSVMSNRLNEIMKVLTMISTIVLPMNLIAGIYGMNFTNIPETKWDFGYPFALGLMFMMALGALAFFRWRKWV
jgi:magnesium transporter